MILCCPNPSCESNNGSNRLFDVNLTVDEDGVACTNSQDIAGKFHTCCHCGSEATWEEKEAVTS